MILTTSSSLETLRKLNEVVRQILQDNSSQKDAYETFNEIKDIKTKLLSVKNTNYPMLFADNIILSFCELSYNKSIGGLQNCDDYWLWCYLILNCKIHKVPITSKHKVQMLIYAIECSIKKYIYRINNYKVEQWIDEVKEYFYNMSYIVNTTNVYLDIKDKYNQLRKDLMEALVKNKYSINGFLIYTVNLQ